MKKVRDISNEEMMEIFNDPRKREIFNNLNFGGDVGNVLTGDWELDYKKKTIEEYGEDPSKWPDNISWVVHAEKSAKAAFEKNCRNARGELFAYRDYYYLNLKNLGEARFKKDTAEDLGLIETENPIGISVSSDDDLANASDQEKIEYIHYLENVINTIAKGARDVHSKFTSWGPSYKYGERASDQIVNLIQDAIKGN